MLNWLPLLMQARALPKNEVGFAQTGFNLGGAAAALLMGFLLDRRARLPSIGLTVVALPAALLVLAIAPNGSVVLVALPLLVGAAILSFQVILYGVTSRAYPAAAQGAGMGAAVESVASARLSALSLPEYCWARDAPHSRWWQPYCHCRSCADCVWQRSAGVHSARAAPRSSSSARSRTQDLARLRPRDRPEA